MPRTLRRPPHSVARSATKAAEKPRSNRYAASKNPVVGISSANSAASNHYVEGVVPLGRGARTRGVRPRRTQPPTLAARQGSWARVAVDRPRVDQSSNATTAVTNAKSSRRGKHVGAVVPLRAAREGTYPTSASKPDEHQRQRRECQEVGAEPSAGSSHFASCGAIRKPAGVAAVQSVVRTLRPAGDGPGVHQRCEAGASHASAAAPRVRHAYAASSRCQGRGCTSSRLAKATNAMDAVTLATSPRVRTASAMQQERVERQRDDHAGDDRFHQERDVLDCDPEERRRTAPRSRAPCS